VLAGLYFGAIVASAVVRDCGWAHALGATLAVSALTARSPVANRVLNRCRWGAIWCVDMLCSLVLARGVTAAGSREGPSPVQALRLAPVYVRL
jgi:hypothetical protein